MIWPLAPALAGTLPPLAVQMIAVGEETGKLEGMLISVADYYDQEVKRTTQRLVALLQPALILIMGLVVGVVEDVRQHALDPGLPGRLVVAIKRWRGRHGNRSRRRSGGRPLRRRQ